MYISVQCFILKIIAYSSPFTVDAYICMYICICTYIYTYIYMYMCVVYICMSRTHCKKIRSQSQLYHWLLTQYFFNHIKNSKGQTCWVTQDPTRVFSLEWNGIDNCFNQRSFFQHYRIKYPNPIEEHFPCITSSWTKRLQFSVHIIYKRSILWL